MIAKPIRALELHYPMIQFLIITFTRFLIVKVAIRETPCSSYPRVPQESSLKRSASHSTF